MTTEWSRSHRLTTILVIVVGIVSGCASVFQSLDDRTDRKRFKSDYEAFESALANYDQGDYTQALEQFKALSTGSASQKMARIARLGEICCRLMLADTQADYTAAVGMWHEFGRSSPEDDAVWDLTLLDPLVVRMAPKNITRVIKIHSPAPQMPMETKMPTAPRQDDGRLQAELVELKKKAEQAAELQQQMDKIEAENRSLKEKIKALETIDQNIRKKKTEIAAPSE